MSKYLNPFTDFGFKKLFGEESSKEILIDFLNEILREEEGEIIDLEFMKNEHLGKTNFDRKAIFDLYCKNKAGERFIVEMQKAKHNYFKDRSLFYATFPIQEQAQKGEWNYQLKAVYTIGILDFVFEEGKDEEKMLYRVKLTDIETQKIFYDKLTFVYIEMPKFTKSLDDCASHFDRWLYVLRNLEKLERYPELLQEKIFRDFFHKAELTQLDSKEREQYSESLKNYRDIKGVIDTAFDDGKEEGREEGEKIGIAKTLICYTNKSNQEICQETKLSLDFIMQLRKNLQG